jgi:Na+-transporting methylmalonyl-CoA/oxaloacetate decarboxylase gamma subunit
MAEWLSFGLNITIIGISIVFLALIIISAAISFIKRLDDRWETREKMQTEAALDKDQSIDTTTLVLIAAAVATMIQGRYHIKRIRRLLPRGGEKGPWSVHGRAVLLGSHVVPKKR